MADRAQDVIAFTCARKDSEHHVVAFAGQVQFPVRHAELLHPEAQNGVVVVDIGGDVIATGTPAGVGAPRGDFLRAGDEVVVQIDQLGTLSNPVV